MLYGLPLCFLLCCCGGLGLLFIGLRRRDKRQQKEASGKGSASIQELVLPRRVIETVDWVASQLGLDDYTEEEELNLPRRMIETSVCALTLDDGDEMISRTESFNSTATSLSQASDARPVSKADAVAHVPSLETVLSADSDVIDDALWEQEVELIRRMGSCRARAALGEEEDDEPRADTGVNSDEQV